jgi:hypothetical protein
MTSNSLRVVLCLAALVVVATWSSTASAYCGTCGGGGVAYYAPTTYTASYAPAYAYTTAYRPATYTAYYGSGGWWPGRCLGRLFGWQSNYAVSYAPTYAVSYAPACTTCASPCTSCASPCTSCASSCTSCASPCTSCAQQVSMQPVYGCSDCGSSCSSCSSCSGCTSCGYGSVSQAVYQSSSGCSSCGQSVAPASTTVVAPGRQTVVAPGVTSGQPSTSGSTAPELAPGQQVPPRTYENMMNENGGPQPTPTDGTSPSDVNNPTQDPLNTDSNANFFEAPKLFNPNDRTATRVAAPVRHAVYEKPASYQQVSTGRITAAQAQQDAAGWTSASH